MVLFFATKIIKWLGIDDNVLFVEKYFWLLFLNIINRYPQLCVFADFYVK